AEAFVERVRPFRDLGGRPRRVLGRHRPYYRAEPVAERSGTVDVVSARVLEDLGAVAAAWMSTFDLAQVDRLLTTTRTVRKRLDLDRAVEPEVITECLRLATYTPNAANTQQWRWVVVTDAEKREQVA